MAWTLADALIQRGTTPPKLKFIHKFLNKNKPTEKGNKIPLLTAKPSHSLPEHQYFKAQSLLHATKSNTKRILGSAPTGHFMEYNNI